MASANSAVSNVGAIAPSVSSKADETVTININKSTAEILEVAFKLQHQYENESKFQRAFQYDAAKAQCLYMARATLQKWDGVVNKATKRFPKLSREQVVEQLLGSGNKDVKELHELSVTATAVIAQFKV